MYDISMWAGVWYGLMYDLWELISRAINIIGLGIIAWWVAKWLLRFLRYEKKIIFNDGHTQKMMHVRRNLAIYLLLWLEFIVASDIIDTMLNLDQQKLLLLGGLIVIRIIVWYSLDKEIKEYEEMKRKKEYIDDDEDEGKDDDED